MAIKVSDRKYSILFGKSFGNYFYPCEIRFPSLALAISRLDETKSCCSTQFIQKFIGSGRSEAKRKAEKLFASLRPSPTIFYVDFVAKAKSNLV